MRTERVPMGTEITLGDYVLHKGCPQKTIWWDVFYKGEWLAMYRTKRNAVDHIRRHSNYLQDTNYNRG